ncbi:hypothetical protein BCR35DRAFT_273628 [Leucosporidium creatinivorum]|uniref:PHD-zinc-finger like domain-domain-containing protein n=1 Tax=Leucosporidium creatinivorum TaxID=106004 RepID=A0A1Y2G3K5_9BASI|nr:hypothetical protein BCR35DRAFT_273628 [Leucosporidium creatinivorum]
MAHGHEPQPIPVVEYKIVDPSVLVAPDVHNNSAAFYGFNDGKEWMGGNENDQDTRYIRYLPPMEADLAKQVEYDMDEQDQIWLDALNAERKGEGIAPVSYETFEILFDKLEKEWFDLSKSIPKKPSPAMEESVCAICDDGECENSNAIVFCDGCNLAVHQDCYGVPYIPEGQWLCRKCTVSPDKPVSCVLCPNSYGAFKQTTTAQWAHLLCAIWVPDTGVSNTVYMEPIDGVENISKNRWKLVCYLCRKRVGACIQCANRNCFTAFHVTCARDHGLELKMKQGTGVGGELKAYCEKHSDDTAAVQARKAARQASGQTSLRITLNGHGGILKSAKSSRAYKKSYSSGPPLIPSYVLDRVNQYTSKLKVVNKKDFMNLLCRYWSLKREARRGAPLLKRLHLEPWTASGTSHHQTEQEKAKKLELMRLVRNDLEKVRMLTERVRKREKKKLERAQLFKSWIDDFIFPKDKKMREVLARVAALDKQQFFAQPVSRSLAPDYYDIIEHPMDWATMVEKIDRHEYLTATDFQDDVDLVINNARHYNKKDSVIHRHAVRIREAADEILSELDALDEHTSDPSVLQAQLGELVTPEYLEQLFDFSYDPPPKKAVEKEKPAEPQEEEETPAEPEKEASVEDKDATSKTNDKGKDKGKGRATVAPTSMRASRSKSGGEDPNAMDVDAEGEVEPPVDPKTPAPASRKRRGSTDKGKGTDRDAKRRKKGDSPPAVVEEAEAEESTPRYGMLREFKELGALAGTPVVSSRPNPREAARLRLEEAEKEKEGDGKKEKTSTSASASASASAAKGKGKEKEQPKRKERSNSVEDKDPGKVKRSSIDEEELKVVDVDPRASFKLFESGWVLPEGSSRRRSTTADPSAVAAPTPSTSRRGYAYEPIIESDPAEAVREASPEEVAVKTPAPPSKKAAPPPTRSRKGKEKEVDLPEEKESVKTAEEPATGRSARKSTAAARETVAPPPKPRLRAERTPKSKEKSEEKEKDSGGDVEMKTEEAVAEEGEAPKSARRKGIDRQPFIDWQQQVAALEDKVAVTKDTELFDGLLVWARTAGHWPFPAEIADPDDESTPQALLDAKPPRADHEELIPVMFFDDTRSGCWCSRKDMRLLGECEEMDQLLLQHHSVNTINKYRQKPLTEHGAAVQLEDLQEAYTWAKSMIELPGEQEAGEQPTKAVQAPTRRALRTRAGEKGKKKGKK